MACESCGNSFTIVMDEETGTMVAQRTLDIRGVETITEPQPEVHVGLMGRTVTMFMADKGIEGGADLSDDQAPKTPTSSLAEKADKRYDVAVLKSTGIVAIHSRSGKHGVEVELLDRRLVAPVSAKNIKRDILKVHYAGWPVPAA